MKLSKMQRLVLSAIQANPGVQNDDAALNACVWTMQGWRDNRPLYDNLKNVARPESIARRRRELFNMGLITYSDKAMKSREEAFNNERNRKAVPWMKD